MKFDELAMMHELGSGTFGVVWLALTPDGREVAVKEMVPGKTPPLDQALRRLFRREAQILQEHRGRPHVVQLLHADLARERPVLVMEFCEGGTLQQWIERRHPWKEIAAVLLHCCRGLSFLHDLGGFHRDIKPSNMLLKKEAEGLVVKLSDFGLARAPLSNATFTRSPGGTDAYMAPEIRANAAYTAAADIYSLGKSGIALATGWPVLPPQPVVPESPAFSDLLQRMVNEAPHSRPSLKQVAEELEGILEPAQTNAKPKEGASGGGLLPWLLLGGAALAVAAAAGVFDGDST